MWSWGVAKKAAANKALPRLLNQGRNILTRRMDRLMVQFRVSAPELFAEYRAARKIVGQPGSQNGKATNIVPG
jgi:O-antigen/teichoic acid export membrane protein